MRFLKIKLFALITLVFLSLTDCTRVDPRCKKNGKKVKKMRRENPNFTF